MCEREGSTATGLLQGLKAVMLFLGSAAAFCGRQRSQCLTPHKARQRERARARASAPSPVENVPSLSSAARRTRAR